MNEDTDKIGIVGLDTSHAENFSKTLMARSGTTVGGVWDGRAVRKESYVADFCDWFDAREYDTPNEMVEDVDAAMILTANWDQHRSAAEPFLTAGVPTFVDKPVAGSVEDVEAIEQAARDGGAPLFGGSAVPFHPDIEGMRADVGRHDLFSAGFNGPFYYGVHLTDAARRICDADWKRIEPALHRETATVTFEDGSNATVRLDGPTEDAAFGFLDVGSTVRTAHIGSSEAELQSMYEPFIDAFLETVRSDRDDRAYLCDAATLVLGVQAALKTSQPIEPGCSALRAMSCDGTAFVREYDPLY